MASVLAAAFCVFVGLVLPLGALVFLAACKRRLVVPFLLGAATFLVGQVLLRAPLLQLLGRQTWFNVFAAVKPLDYAVLLGASAGAFEELGRYGMMRLGMRRSQTLNAALAFGLGHGGLEGILLIGINYLVMLGGSLFAPHLFTLPAAHLALLAGLERLFAYMAHVGWSVMVMQAVRRHQPQWLTLAFVTHTLLDSVILILQQQGVGILGIEFYVALGGLALLAYTIVTVRRERKEARFGQNTQTP